MIIFDLDGTLADCEHRRYLVDPSKNKDCEPIFPHIMLMNAFTKPKWVYKDISPINDPTKRKEFKPNWELFYRECEKDTVIMPTASLICLLVYRGVDVEIWSARCESVRGQTLKWINTNLFSYSKEDCPPLKMRPIGDSIPDEVLKEQWLDEALEQGKTIEFVFDDRPKVVEMWRRRGIFVFNCCQHNEKF